MYKLYHEHMCIVLPKRDNCFYLRKKGKLLRTLRYKCMSPRVISLYMSSQEYNITFLKEINCLEL